MQAAVTCTNPIPYPLMRIAFFCALFCRYRGIGTAKSDLRAFSVRGGYTAFFAGDRSPDREAIGYEAAYRSPRYTRGMICYITFAHIIYLEAIHL